MNQTEKPRRKLSRALLIACLVLLILSVLAGGAYSKYRKKVVMTDEIQYGSRLVEQFRLLEHKTEMQDGVYQLSKETTVSDSALYIPGAVIPMDPSLSITGKTEIPAFLYVEVVDGNPKDMFRYALTSDWSELDGVTGYHGGTVFVYRDGQEITDSTNKNLLASIPILRDGEVTLGEEPVSQVKALQFCGYLIQTEGNQSPAQLYQSHFSH